MAGLPVLQGLDMDVTSPQNSVDMTAKDRASIQEELERRLRCRADRDDLVKKGILPDISTSPKLFTQTQQLQRARIADNLQKRLRNRVDRHELMKLNILPDLQSNIDPALQAKQLQLRKNKLADQLNEKLAQRPGPLELVQGGILEPRNSELAAVVHSVTFEKTGKPEPAAPEKPLHRHSLPGPSALVSPPSLDSQHGLRKFSESSLSPANSPGTAHDESKSPGKSPQPILSPPFPLPPLPAKAHLKDSFGKAPSPSQTRKKQQKQQKYRKLRYHEYVPPSKNNSKGGKTTPKSSSKSDSPYALRLQQQQLFLQLQVLQQQYPNGVLMQKLPDLVKTLSKDPRENHRGSDASPGSDGKVQGPSVPPLLQVEQPNRLGVGSVRFDELKVSDLKAACKELGMIVSGKKVELVERLLENNRGVLPAVALPDGQNRDNRRQAYGNTHPSSTDSQVSGHSAASPSSPSPSPIFKFPGEHHSTSQAPPTSTSGTLSAPQVFPASDLQQQFDEMVEQQKLRYINHPKAPKSLAPRPELHDMVAIKFSCPMDTRAKGSTLPHRSSEAKLQLQESEQQSRSLPSSPNPLSPSEQFLNEIMDDSSNHNGLEEQLTASLPPFSTNSKQMEPLFFIPKDVTPTMAMSTSAQQCSDSLATNDLHTGPPPSYYHQKPSMRPMRTSLPVMPPPKVHPMPPPSYNSTAHLMHRSHSLTAPVGPSPAHTGLPRMHSGPALCSEVSEVMMAEDGLASDLMDIPMETDYSKDQQFSEIFDILRDSDGAFVSHSQPPSLSSHYPKTHLADSIMFSGAFPFSNPPLGQASKSGSDHCLFPGREGQKNSITNSTGAAFPGNELSWLDLNSDSALSLSPTVGGGFGTHSNPGSLPHEQFHLNFFEELQGSNPTLNSGHAPPYHDPHQALLLPPTSSEDVALLELGLSR